MTFTKDRISNKLPKSLNLLLIALLLLGGAIAVLPVATAGPVPPPATVQFTRDDLLDGSAHQAPVATNATEVFFTGASTLNFTHNGIPIKPYNIIAPSGATELQLEWETPQFVFDGACWAGPDGNCLLGGTISVPKGANDQSITTTDLVRDYLWGTSKSDGTGFRTLESVPVPSDANGYELVLAERPTTTVVCDPSSPVIGTSTTCTATVTDTRGGTPITPTGKVKFSSDLPGTFSSIKCTLSGAGSSASCSVMFTPSSTGAYTITAKYTGDAALAGSRGKFKLTVTT